MKNQVDWVIKTTGELCRPKEQRKISAGTPQKITVLSSGSEYVHTLSIGGTLRKISVVIFREWIFTHFEQWGNSLKSLGSYL